MTRNWLESLASHSRDLVAYGLGRFRRVRCTLFLLLYPHFKLQLVSLQFNSPNLDCSGVGVAAVRKMSSPFPRNNRQAPPMDPSTSSTVPARAPSKYVTDDDFEPQPSAARRPPRATAANGDRCVLQPPLPISSFLGGGALLQIDPS